INVHLGLLRVPPTACPSAASACAAAAETRRIADSLTMRRRTHGPGLCQRDVTTDLPEQLNWVAGPDIITPECADSTKGNGNDHERGAHRPYEEIRLPDRGAKQQGNGGEKKRHDGEDQSGRIAQSSPPFRPPHHQSTIEQR